MELSVARTSCRVYSRSKRRRHFYLEHSGGSRLEILADFERSMTAGEDCEGHHKSRSITTLPIVAYRRSTTIAAASRWLQP